MLDRRWYGRSFTLEMVYRIMLNISQSGRPAVYLSNILQIQRRNLKDESKFGYVRKVLDNLLEHRIPAQILSGTMSSHLSDPRAQQPDGVRSAIASDPGNYRIVSSYIRRVSGPEIFEFLIVVAPQGQISLVIHVASADPETNLIIQRPKHAL